MKIPNLTGRNFIVYQLARHKLAGNDVFIYILSLPSQEEMNVFFHDFSETCKVGILHAFMEYRFIETCRFCNFADRAIVKKSIVGCYQVKVAKALDNRYSSFF